MNLQEGKRQLQVYMPIERFLWVQEAAKKEERSMTWIVNQAIEKMRQDENRQTKEPQ